MGSGASICRSSRVADCIHSQKYSFHERHGKKAILTNSFAARRHKTKQYRNGAVVMTKQNIDPEVPFAIRLDRTNRKWAGNLEFGVTTASADEISFLSNMADCRSGTTILWSGSEIFRNGKLIETDLNYDLEDFTVGDSIAVKVIQGSLPQFYFNGEKVRPHNGEIIRRRSGKPKTDNVRSGNTVWQSNSEDRNDTRDNIAPETFYGVVDICGRAKSVSICEFNKTENSSAMKEIEEEIGEEEWVEPVADRFMDTNTGIHRDGEEDLEEEEIMKKMRRTVIVLNDISNPCLAAKLALRDLLKPAFKKDSKERQKYGDHLASVDMADELADLNETLAEKNPTASFDNTETEEWKAIRAVREILWMYSHYSMKLCKRLGETGIPKHMLNDLTNYSSQPQKHKYMLTSALAIFYNCSKATGNRKLYVDLQAAGIFKELRDCTDLAIRTTALFIQAYLVDDKTRSGNEFQAGEDVIAACVERLENALSGEALERQNEDGLSLFDVVTGIRNLASNDSHKAMLLENGVAGQLVDLIKRKDKIEIEQECALSAFLVLCQDAEQREKIKNMQNIMNIITNTANEGEGHLPLQQAAKRLLIELKSETKDINDNKQEHNCDYKRVCKDVIRNSPKIEEKNDNNQEHNCEYKRACKDFLRNSLKLEDNNQDYNCEYRRACKDFIRKSLKIKDVYFNPNLDKCFCNDCCSFRKEPMVYTRGTPQMDYCVPAGWCRFALEIPPRARANRIFNEWHVAFHGTKRNVVSPILDHGDLLMPGDVTMLGEDIGENPSNFIQYKKPDEFDTKQIFVSPCIRYAGLDQYAAECDVDVAGIEYTKAKVAFQVRIKPDAYKVGPQTIKEDLARIDLHISNQEIEWFTKKRGCIVLSGLLVKLRK